MLSTLDAHPKCHVTSRSDRDPVRVERASFPEAPPMWPGACHGNSDSSDLAPAAGPLDTGLSQVPRDSGVSQVIRDREVQALTTDLLSALSKVVRDSGSLYLLTVGMVKPDDLRRWCGDQVLVIPACSFRHRRHGHGLLSCFDSFDAEDALAYYCAESGVARGACDLSPVKGWRVRDREPAKLHTNVFRILCYALDDTRQGTIDVDAVAAFGVFADPWTRFLDSGARLLWAPPSTAKPCRLISCDQLVSGKRETCCDAHRQEIKRHEDRDRRPDLRAHRVSQVTRDSGVRQ